MLKTIKNLLKNKEDKKELTFKDVSKKTINIYKEIFQEKPSNKDIKTLRIIDSYILQFNPETKKRNIDKIKEISEVYANNKNELIKFKNILHTVNSKNLI